MARRSFKPKKTPPKSQTGVTVVRNRTLACAYCGVLKQQPCTDVTTSRRCKDRSANAKAKTLEDAP